MQEYWGGWGRTCDPHGDDRGKAGCLHQHTAAEGRRSIVVAMLRKCWNESVKMTTNYDLGGGVRKGVRLVGEGIRTTHIPHLKRCNRAIPVCGSASYVSDWHTLPSPKR